MNLDSPTLLKLETEGQDFIWRLDAIADKIMIPSTLHSIFLGTENE